jgi:hypothetical protein
LQRQDARFRHLRAYSIGSSLYSVGHSIGIGGLDRRSRVSGFQSDCRRMSD